MSMLEPTGALSSPEDEKRHQQALGWSVVSLEISWSPVLTPLQITTLENAIVYHFPHNALNYI